MKKTGTLKEKKEKEQNKIKSLKVDGEKRTYSLLNMHLYVRDKVFTVVPKSANILG